MPISRIIGREDEKATILALLEQESLVTLTGLGGIGKTTLARDIVREIPTPWWFVSLAHVNAKQITWAIAQELNLPDAHREQQHIITFFRRAPGLLVLDNFEHLMDGASLVGMLLEACPNLKILVTSREELQLREEVVVEIPPLPLPASVSLFLQRASQILPQLPADIDHVGIVAEICRRLEGIPLAIELAVSRLSLFSLEELKNRLDRRLHVLSGGPRSAPERQQT